MISVLETKHLILRKAREEDVEAIWKNIWSVPNIAKTMLWTVTPTFEDAKERMRKTIDYQSETNPQIY